MTVSYEPVKPVKPLLCTEYVFVRRHRHHCVWLIDHTDRHRCLCGLEWVSVLKP